MSNNPTPVFDFNLLRRIVRLAAPYKRVFYSSVGLSLFLSAIGPLRPWLVQQTIDKYILQFNAPMLWTMSAIMIGLLLVESLGRYAFNILTARLGQDIIKDLRMRVFGHILNSRLGYFDTTPIGTSTTRTITDIEAVNDTFSEGIITIVADIMSILVIIGFMLVMSWKLALVSLCTIPLLLVVTRWFQEGVKKSFQEERTQIARMNAFLQEHITGMRIIQIFNAEEKEKKKFAEINSALRDANIRGIWYYSLFFPAVEILSTLAIGLMVFVASYEILNLRAQPGIIMAFILYINNLYRPLRFMADKVNTIQRGIVAAERVFKLLDKNEHIANNGKHVPAQFSGDIRFSKVWFAYNEENWVLKDLSFHLPAGETLAIVGATGSGKTSTISLLGRFYEIQKGQIEMDGVNISDYQLAELRNKMAVVLQDVFLFAGSIFENITLRNPAITREQVIAASQLIGAHSFISRLPGAYEYRVMERGATLSMGQRQLISFVRALVYNPAILILDEATSSIDSESEALIQQAIEKLVKGRTSIVIAHRLSTIRHAHKILVLDRGRKVEFGTHQQLLENNGPYRNLHEMQFGEVLAG